MPEKTDNSSANIYELLLEASEKKKREKKEKRTELLKSMGVQEYFEEGNIKIDMKTCRGIECNLCVEVCPTNALYWKAGEIGIVEDLCVYCTACVFNCVVDNCIQVTRKRPNGKIEKFSTPRDVLTLLNNTGSGKRSERVKSRFPTAEDYLKRYS
ncbi:MAG: 4Fe-4S binding protein [Candidatus Bathyarchaeaceae archaeon]